jgi:hypothetical protein
MRIEIDTCEACGVAVLTGHMREHWEWHGAQGHKLPIEPYKPHRGADDYENECEDCGEAATWRKDAVKYCGECVADGSGEYRY